MILRFFLVLFLSGNLWAKNSFDDYYRLESEAEQLEARYTELGIHWKQRTDLSAETKKKMKAEYDEVVDRFIEVSKEMKKLEEVLTVEAWSHKLNKMQKINQSFKGDVVNNRICDQQGEYQYFINNDSFEKWNQKNGSSDKKIEYYSRKDPYIASCLNRKTDGNSIKVSGTYRKICNRWIGPIGTYNSTSYNYKLEKKNGQMVISAKIFVDYRGKPEREAEAFVLLLMELPCMQNFYAKHGIKLDLEFERITSKSDISRDDLTIGLHDEYDRASAYNWVTHKNGKRELYSFERCSLFTHELGHLFGLSDAYPDPDCPDREKIGAIDDIMNDSWRGADYTKFYDYQIEQLLKPLCEN